MAINLGFRHKKGRQWTSLNTYMVPVGGLEPPLPKQLDFESNVYTNFTIPAWMRANSNVICLLAVGLRGNNKAEI